MYQKCPVCNGRGIVPHMFYTITEEQETFSSSSTAPETCRACGGKGIIPIESKENDYEVIY